MSFFRKEVIHMHQYRKWVQILVLTMFFFLLNGFISFSVMAEEVDDPVMDPTQQEEVVQQEQPTLENPEPEQPTEEIDTPEESMMEVQEQTTQDVSNFDG